MASMGDLTPQELTREKAWYIVRSLGVEKSKKYLSFFQTQMNSFKAQKLL